MVHVSGVLHANLTGECAHLTVSARVPTGWPICGVCFTAVYVRDGKLFKEEVVPATVREARIQQLVNFLEHQATVTTTLTLATEAAANRSSQVWYYAPLVWRMALTKFRAAHTKTNQ